MSSFPSLEERSLKKKTHYPPDVYFQRDDQKEDLMSEDFVRDGFKYVKPVRDEYESCREESKFVNVDSLWNFFRSVVTHKSECPSFQDSKKKQAPSVRDTLVPVIHMYKEQVSDWFRELAGTVPLQNLGRRVPYYKDKEEILNELLLNKVPITRSIWFINMSVIQSAALAENAKKKPRAPSDPTLEWTTMLCRMLTRILEQINGESPNDSLELDWDYLFTLLIAMYDMDMADHWEVLMWLVKQAEHISKPMSQPDPSASPTDQSQSAPQESVEESRFRLKFFLHYLLRAGCRFTENELLTRRLLYWCCYVLSEVTFRESRLTANEQRSTAQVVLDEYNESCACPLHRVIVMSLSSLIVCLTLTCPSAAVWNYIPVEKDHMYLRGSPLDLIPYSLVALPMPRGPEVISVRKCLTELEEIIITRGRLAELGWNRQAGTNMNGEHAERLVRLLDILDRQDYYVASKLNPMESLFSLIFNDDSLHVDTASLVITLCEWAVSTQRVGIHRAIIVACLLEQLWFTLQANDTSRKLFQDTLVCFLDTFAANLPPFVGDQAPVDNEPMRNLVCLFGELIDRQLFDHDAYVRHYIARGAFNTSDHPLAMDTVPLSHNQPGISNTNLGANTPNISRSTHIPGSLTTFNLSNNATAQHSVASEISEENDRFSMDNPDSVRSELGFPSGFQPAAHMSSHFASADATITDSGSTVVWSPHLHFLAQFPIPQGECYAHEQNQRYQLLYGSVRARDPARCRVRQLARDIGKLFTKKSFLIDVVHGEMCKRRRAKDRDKDKESSVSGNLSSNTAHRSSEDAHSTDRLHDEIMARFLRLSYHDMECVISQCTPTFVKMLSGSSGGPANNTMSDEHTSAFGLNNPPSPTGSTIGSSANNVPGGAVSYPGLPQLTNTQPHIYMPVPSSIFLFFDLIETSLNITCLLSTVVDTLERLNILFENRTQFMTLYMSFLCLRAIGILQRYQPVLLTMNVASRLFPTLIDQVRPVKEPTQCGPSERCILAYLNDLFSSSAAVRTGFTWRYGKAHPKVLAIFRQVVPADGTGTFDPHYAAELLEETSQDNVVLFRAYAEDLRNNPDSRFSFVCRAIMFVCQADTSERLNYLCGLCVELTSQCGALSSEWIGSLIAVLAPRPYVHSYVPLVNAVDPSNVNMYDNLSSLIGTLLSRHCITISDFLHLVLCPAMARGLGHVSQPVGPQVEPIIRLACHILHRLFTAESTVSSLQTASNVLTPSHEVPVSTTVGHGTSDTVAPSPPFRISEPLLLTGALQKVGPELLVDVLKILTVHYDKAATVDLVNADPNESVDGSGESQPPQDNDNEEDDDSGPAQGSDLDSDDEQDSTDEASSPVDSARRRKRAKQNDNKSRQRKRNRVTIRGANSTTYPIHFIVQRYLESGTLPTVAELRSISLSGLIQLVLREICTVGWVRERFCRMPPERLICKNVLIDKNFSHCQARRLLHTIFCPYDVSWSDTAATSEGLAGAMCHVLSNLNLWSLRYAQMQFQLLYAQIPFSQQSEVLGFVAQGIVSEFQRQAKSWLTADGSSVFNDGSVCLTGGLPCFELDDPDDPVWLLPALVQKLPNTIKAQIVKATLETLKGILNFWKHKNDEDKESVLLEHSVILAHPAFFALLQICLQDGDPMEALKEQIECFVQNARETEDRVPDNLRTRQVVQECLRLRLTLVGQRFQDIQRDTDTCNRWAMLLTQLISHGVTEPESNSALFFMVLDMLQTLVHTSAARSGLEGKHYQNLVKKLRRELSERPPTSGIEQIRPLLIPLKTAYTVFVTGRTRQRAGASGASGGSSSGGPGSGSLGKSSGAGKASGNKGSGKSTSVNRSGLLGSTGNLGSGSGRGNAKKRGFMIIGKERFAPWDIQDPGKQSALLSMHGATLSEAILSRTEEQANRLISHDHFVRLRRSLEFYLTPVYPEKDEPKPKLSGSSTAQSRPTSTTKPPKREPNNASSMLPPALGSQFDPVISSVPVNRKLGTTGSGVKKIPTRTFASDVGVIGGEDALPYGDSLRMTGTIQHHALNIADNLEKINSGMHHIQSDYPQEFSQEHPRSSVPFGSGMQMNAAKLQYTQSNMTLEPLGGSHMHNIPQSLQKSMDIAKHGPGFNDLSYPPGDPMLTKTARLTTSKFAGDLPTLAPMSNEMSASFSTSIQPTKRKRGAGRRAAVAERPIMGAAIHRPNPSITPSGRNMNANPRTTTAARLAPVGLMDPVHSISMVSSAETIPDISSSVAAPTSWTNKQFSLDTMGPDTQQQPNRGPAHLANLTGFLRNRAQQQQQQQQQQQHLVSMHSHHQQQQPPTYTTFTDSNSIQPGNVIRGPQQELCGQPIYVQQSSGQTFDSSIGLSHSLGVSGTNQSYPDNSINFVTSLPQSTDHMIVNSGRQQLGHVQSAPRYVPQMTAHRNQHMAVQQSLPAQGNQSQSQSVPNPPPYPISQSNHPHMTHPHSQQQPQQHTLSRNPEDNYVLMIDPNTDETTFVRTSGGQSSMSHVMHRQAAYQTAMPQHQTHLHTHLQQQHSSVGNQLSSVQMMSHTQHGLTPMNATYQRVPNPGQLHVSQQQHQQPQQNTNPTQTHYPRFTY